MILNNADNVMYGNEEVERLYYGKYLVWERTYKWINNNTNQILGYRGNKKPSGEIYLNWCISPYTVTIPITLPKFNMSNAALYYDLFTLSPRPMQNTYSYNIFGDTIEECSFPILLEYQQQVLNYSKPINFFENIDLKLNQYSRCTKISDFAFALRKLSSISFTSTRWTYAEDSYFYCEYGLNYIGSYAFFKTTVNKTDKLYLYSNQTSYSGSNSFYYPTYIGKCAFAYSNVVDNLYLDNSSNSNISDCIIDEYAFNGCSSLNTVNFKIPKNQKVLINKSAFGGCKNLSNILFDDNSSIYCYFYLYSGSFNNCSSLKSIKFKCNVYLVGDDIFENSSLEEVEFQTSSYIEISEYAFRYCDTLQKIIIPGISKKSKIAQNAFETQVKNNCRFIINGDTSSDISPKQLLIDSGVPESLIE